MSAKFNMMDTKITNTVNRIALGGANQLTGNQQRAEEQRIQRLSFGQNRLS